MVPKASAKRKKSAKLATPSPSKSEDVASATAVKISGSKSATVTVTVLIPELRPRVSVAEARPLESVVADSTESIPSPAVTVNVTLAPSRGFPLRSSTSTANGLASCAPLSSCCSSPEIFSRVSGPGIVHSDTSHNCTGLYLPPPEASMVPSIEKGVASFLRCPFQGCYGRGLLEIPVPESIPSFRLHLDS